MGLVVQVVGDGEIYGKIEQSVEDDNDKTVLVAYFIGGKSIEETARLMNYSRAHTYRFWKRGIKDISEYIKKNETNET